MQHVAELVHQRLELVVVQTLAVEVGHERAQRRALRDPAHAADREGCRVVELALAREEIEVEAGDELAGLRVHDVEVAHVGMPQRHLLLDELHAVERLRHEERVFDRLVRGEVLAQLLLVHLEAHLAHHLRVVRHVPPVDLHPRDGKLEVLRLHPSQVVHFLRLEAGHGGLHVGEELVHHVGRAHHLAAQRVVGEGRQAVEARELLPQLEDLEQQVEVLRATLVHLRHVVALARLPALRVLQERQVRGIVEAEHDVAAGVGRVRLEVRLRHAGQVLRLERDLGGIVADVAVEGLAQLLDLLEDLLGAPALVRRQGHARVLEALDQVLLEFRLVRVHRLRGIHAREELLVLEEVGLQCRVLLQAGLGRVTRRLVGRDVAQQVDGVHGVLDHDRKAVPFVEDRAGALLRAHLLDERLRAGDALIARAGDAGRVVERHERPRGRRLRRGEAGERRDSGKRRESEGHQKTHQVLRFENQEGWAASS